jgi:hypothetical protein
LYTLPGSRKQKSQSTYKSNSPTDLQPPVFGQNLGKHGFIQDLAIVVNLRISIFSWLLFKCGCHHQLCLGELVFLGSFHPPYHPRIYPNAPMTLIVEDKNYLCNSDISKTICVSFYGVYIFLTELSNRGANSTTDPRFSYLPQRRNLR